MWYNIVILIHFKGHESWLVNIMQNEERDPLKTEKHCDSNSI